MSIRIEAFEGLRLFSLLELGLSQIYLNVDKIEAIEKWFDPSDLSNMEPLTVHDFGNGKYTLTDGHSRAYVAYKNGLSHVPIVYDNDAIVVNELGQKLYRMDIEWCERFCLASIRDLSNRILSNEEYNQLWVARCDKGYNLLSQTNESERMTMQNKASDLHLYGASEDLSQLYFEDDCGNEYVLCNRCYEV